MSSNLRDAYNEISLDYLKRKSQIWHDFTSFFDKLNWERSDIVIDVGAGNGRNLSGVSSNHHVALDLSMALLQGFNGPKYTSRVVGALPSLPFRKKVAEKILLIAVIHHLVSEELRVISLKETNRISLEGEIVISVWRKWRRGVRERIIDAIKSNEDPEPYFNVQRPWKDSKGNVIATRFYHYFTMKELRRILHKSGLDMIRYAYLGGRFKDANIFVLVKESSNENLK